MTEIQEFSDSEDVAGSIILHTTEEPSSSSFSAKHISGGREIDHHNPIITDSRRASKPTTPKFPQPPPVSPEPQNKKLNQTTSKGAKIKWFKKRMEDVKRRSADEPNESVPDVVKKEWNNIKSSDNFSPPASSRYLLGDPGAFLDGFSDFNPVLELDQPESSNSNQIKTGESSVSKPSSASSSTKDQVVMLRVSLHCRGCERKMRKHIARMKGVTSFNIDFATKQVTVIGDVTPLGVLTSISKVKNAKLWTAPSISSYQQKNKD